MICITEELVNFNICIDTMNLRNTMVSGKSKSKEYDWVTFYIFKYRQNYAVCCLSVQTNTVKFYINEKDNLKIQESGSFLSLKEGKEQN